MTDGGSSVPLADAHSVGGAFTMLYVMNRTPPAYPAQSVDDVWSWWFCSMISNPERWSQFLAFAPGYPPGRE